MSTNPENTSSENLPMQWMMKQMQGLSGAVVSLETRLDTELKNLSGTVVLLQTKLQDLSRDLISLQTKLDTELKHLPTQDDVRTLEREMATIGERTSHLATKADMNLLKGISSFIAVAAVSIAVKLFFFGGS